MSKMQAFEISLPEGRKTTGLVYLPPSRDNETKGKPLIVAIHGGTYTASYYDIDPQHSISNVSKALGVPVVCVTRPGYGESSLQPEHATESHIQQQGRYFNEVILPAIWEKYGGSTTNTTSIVMHAHSIGGAVAIVAAARYSQDADPKYPLSGLITSGVNSTHGDPKDLAKVMEASGEAMEPTKTIDGRDALIWPPTMKKHVMLRPDLGFSSDEVVKAHNSLNHSISLAEFGDIQNSWMGYWRDVASEVLVPHMNTMPEYDSLWTVSQEIVEGFAKAFVKCARMDVSVLPEAPHGIELSHHGQAWYVRSFGFAMECAVGMEMKKNRIEKK